MTNKEENKIRFGGWNHPPYKEVRRKLLRIAFEQEYARDHGQRFRLRLKVGR